MYTKILIKRTLISSINFCNLGSRESAFSARRRVRQINHVEMGSTDLLPFGLSLSRDKGDKGMRAQNNM